MKFINDFAIALVHPKRYKELLNNSVWRVILYVAVLLLISSISLISASKELYGILQEYYKTNIPEFTFENQALSSTRKFDLDLMGMKLMIDTENQLTSEDFGKSFNGVLFDSDSMFLRSMSSDTIEVKYSDLAKPETKFTKASLMTYMPQVKAIINLMGVITFIMTIPLFLLGALITAVLSKLFMGLLPPGSTKLKFSKIYKLALYSRSFPVIASMILSVFIGAIPPILSVLISVFILNRAIASIASSENV